jgi:hypothetical protein
MARSFSKEFGRNSSVPRTHRSNLLSSSHPACLAWLPALVQDTGLFTVIIEKRLKALVWAVDSSSVEPALRHQSRETTIIPAINVQVRPQLYGYVMKLSFSLSKAAKPVGDAPSLKRPANFGTLDDDIANDDDDALPSARNCNVGNGDLVAQNIQLSKSAKQRMEKEQQVDATVYQYDEVWDSMQDAKARQKEIKERESKERKVCHLHVVPQ